MNSPLLATLLLASLPALHAAAADLSKVASRSDLEAVLTVTADAPLKQALTDHAAAILAAAAQHPHVEAVIRTIESAPGTFTKINTTPEALSKAAGGDIALFDTLTHVSTHIVNGKAHVYRDAKDDPYDAAFLGHLGHIPSLESVKIVATKIEDSWLEPLLALKNLKSLSMEGTARGLPGNPALGDASLARLQALTACTQLTSLELAYFGKATDAGFERLAGLKNLEAFTPRGNNTHGHYFAKFEGWTKLRSLNLHSNHLDDEGMSYVCERFPNLEFIKLWHSHALTDASAAHLGKLKKLTGMEISTTKATAALLQHLSHTALEYAALEYGVSAPASDAIRHIQPISTLRRLKILAKDFTAEDLAALASARQLTELTLNSIALTDDRVSELQGFAFLKSLTLSMSPNHSAPGTKGDPEELQAKIKALLPSVDVKFVK
ncbi:MAG: hypothetical protein RLZZ142_298 [Verrucomicrobiota bacterium]